MIEFILNEKNIITGLPGSTTLLDFIRYEAYQKGTKIGCREGDCGACTVLIGSVQNSRLQYFSATSCITPIANVHRKHVVSIEGLNLSTLNQVQSAMVEFSGSQCGFCTPGFVVSMCGFALETKKATNRDAIGSIDGNICRCTGYKSIEKAAHKIVDQLSNKDLDHPLQWLVTHNFIPEYFVHIEDRLKKLPLNRKSNGKVAVGGGTDLYVQKHDDLHDFSLNYLFDKDIETKIICSEDECIISSSATISDLIAYPVFLENIENWYDSMKLVSSTPIRNIGTIAGNFANASPIGDLTIIFLALNAEIVVINEEAVSRRMYLKDLFKSYKNLNLKENEVIDKIIIQKPNQNSRFNFEKVSKRKYLDIASVNSAISIKMMGGLIKEVHFAIGGVGPIPKYLNETSTFLLNQNISAKTIQEAAHILQTEITPISDARGSKEYKRLLARQLFFGHFITLFPNNIKFEDLL